MSGEQINTKPWVLNRIQDPASLRMQISLLRQAHLFKQALKPRIAGEKCKFRRAEIPSDPRWTHRNHLIQNLERTVLVAERCKNQRFTRWPGYDVGNSFGVLDAAGTRICDAQGLRAHNQETVSPYSFQNSHVVG